MAEYTVDTQELHDAMSAVLRVNNSLLDALVARPEVGQESLGSWDLMDAVNRFNKHWWENGASLTDALGSIAAFLGAARKAYEATDQGVAAGSTGGPPS